MNPKPIILHSGQSKVFKSVFMEKNRITSVRAARGWGKSYTAAAAGVNAVFELLALDSSVPNKYVYLIAPTWSQATDIYYPLLQYELGMETFALKSLKSLGKFIFPRHVELRLASYEAIERLRGKGMYFGVNDEMASWLNGEDAFQSVIQPMYNTRWSKERAEHFGAPSPGRVLTISTTKGYNYFYDHHNSADAKFKFDYKSSPYLDPDEIERIRHTIDPIKFASEYLAEFKESGNQVFYCFDRDIHVTKDIGEIDEDEDVHICIDFNVNLQCSGVFTVRGGQLHGLDEFKGAPDTEHLAIAINGRYKNGKRKIYAYPDPTGKRRQSSAPVGVTDFTILEEAGIIVKARRKSPPIIDSVNAVNKHLKTAAGEISMYIHPRCKGMIRSLERTKWVDNNANTAKIDKSGGDEHFSDGIRYITEYLFPIRSGIKVSSGFNF
jgi:hypothetical protein